ncbi:PH domain-containing protein [Sutcliffiella rhizosphaerae]|uniref:YdbS-like PH domain-containing protein n=1 Tax=Sutcliffiella rhizosphaerae TaxID=2880967 RepID=A0ABM8YSD5_9BACI|nr:PH domain-containing protein [Sutcliffiella rhizosphaerae]CAG9622730.1 hypothetical protein BACCIP111883_03521 [Sutcliffiella rhizosphaerae]
MERIESFFMRLRDMLQTHHLSGIGANSLHRGRVFRQSWFTLLTGTNIILAMLTAFMWLIIPIMRILSTAYEITENYLISTNGIISRRIDQVEWYRVKDVQLQQGILGRMFDFGDLIVISSDITHPVTRIKGVSHPIELRREILERSRSSKKESGMNLHEMI